MKIDLNNLLKNFMKQIFLVILNYQLKNNTLNIKIEENPIIQNIEITGIKNKKL